MERIQHEPKAGSSPCTFCGKKGHGRIAPQHVRRTECPAYNSICTACHKKHHFAAVCWGKNRHQQGDARPELQEGAVFDSLCVVNNINRRRDQRFIALDHHLYDQLSNSWLNQSSKPQPYMKLGVDVLVDDYKHFGFESLLTHPTRHAYIMCMADTGCHSCLASIKAISRPGIKRQELIPVTMKMHTANKEGINILGAAILRFSDKTSNGIRESRQIVYVTDVDNKVFLNILPAKPATRTTGFPSANHCMATLNNSRHNKNILLTGDFNLPYMNWDMPCHVSGQPRAMEHGRCLDIIIPRQWSVERGEGGHTRSWQHPRPAGY